jgi:hypothetical protein
MTNSFRIESHFRAGGNEVPHNWSQKEIVEHEEIAREEALQKVAQIVKQFNLRQDEIAEIFDGSDCRQGSEDSNYLISSKPASKLFDPFFDAW